MSINSRNKGKVGEREWAAWLTERGFPAQRGVQHQGGPDSPDVTGGIAGVHFEVKRVENLNIHNAIAQAAKDAGEAIPVVAHRRNRGEWLITKLAEDYILLWKRCLSAEREVKRLKEKYEGPTCSDEIIAEQYAQMIDRNVDREMAKLTHPGMFTTILPYPLSGKGTDLSKCQGKGCPSRETCKRYTMPANNMQSYGLYEETLNGRDRCDYRVEDEGGGR